MADGRPLLFSGGDPLHDKRFDFFIVVVVVVVVVVLVVVRVSKSVCTRSTSRSP